MDDTYESITAAALDAIRAIVSAPESSEIFGNGSAMEVACCVYFSWSDYVGDMAELQDDRRMRELIAMISGVSGTQVEPSTQPSPKVTNYPSSLCRRRKTH